jgi:hypothetical protein
VRSYARDDYSQDTGASDYEASERAAGHREQPAREDLVNDLPEFHHQPAAERAPVIRIHTATSEPAQPPETRMSVAQLRDRISGMEATTRMKATEAEASRNHHGYPGEHRPRLEGPCARNERAEKLTRYRAELARRDGSEAAATAAQDRADLAQRAKERAEWRASEDARRESLDGPKPQPPAVDPAILARLRADSDAEDARRAAQVATAAELPPVPPAEAAATEAASSRRRAVVATAQADSQADTLTGLDRAVELLVRQHTSGAVIDAAWGASKRIFAPAKAGAR